MGRRWRFAGVTTCPSGHAFAFLWRKSGGSRAGGCAAGWPGGARGAACAFDVARRGRRSSTEQVPSVARVTVRVARHRPPCGGRAFPERSEGATGRRPGKPEVCVLRPLNPKKMPRPTPCRAWSARSRATSRCAASESKRSAMARSVCWRVIRRTVCKRPRNTLPRQAPPRSVQAVQPPSKAPPASASRRTVEGGIPSQEATSRLPSRGSAVGGSVLAPRRREPWPLIRHPAQRPLDAPSRAGRAGWRQAVRLPRR